jgi:hypothetical protein
MLTPAIKQTRSNKQPRAPDKREAPEETRHSGNRRQ